MTLLDVAGYGFSHYAGATLALLGKVLLGGIGLLFGGAFLLMVTIVSVIAITAYSALRGVEHVSILKATGTFFRLAGVAVGFIISLIAMPIALIMHAKFITVLFIAIVAIALGYFVGFIFSEIVALRLFKYELYIRVFNNLRYKINGLGNE